MHKGGEAKIAGWTKVINDPIKNAQHWVYFSLKNSQSLFELEVQVNEVAEESPLYIVFYVCAEKVLVGEDLNLFPGLINKYSGMVKNIYFDSKGGSLAISPKFSSQMQLIPLAGSRDFFWGADFLLAFELQKSLISYNFEIS